MYHNKLLQFLEICANSFIWTYVQIIFLILIYPDSTTKDTK